MRLMSYNWQGNIRQLKNLVTRLVTLARTNIIDENDITGIFPDSENTKSPRENFKLNEVEKSHIMNILALCQGNQKKAAELLGIHRNTLARKIKEYNIEIK